MGTKKGKPEGRAVGHPTKYHPSYCQMLVKHMEKGLSFESFAGTIYVHRDTIYEWVKVHEEFSDAKKVGQARSQLIWEQTGLDGLWDITEFDERTGKPTYKKALNPTLWIFNMKNRFGWKDKQEVSTGPGFVPLTAGQKEVDVMSEEEQLKLAKGEE